ncbi:class I SAM-dependent methyltransferase [Actibacterium sp. 188UL27-1]|uniref:class I SAM-dependent methyltransferase n=1 Tax=Actibacterium sp. 188UL27-1 TaxID=2786961 RepID=UPI001959BCA2|nr:class I SAM-dependent methyltransferase [Actibacterium sp. 188UL27-1]MBM7066793.1 hypothetical protein [Actibacterium sp. 188UL27-1]
MWQIHWAKNAIAAVLPFQNTMRRLKRRVTGKTHRIHEASVYSGGFDQIQFLQKSGLDLADADILEVGTGWYPVIPLMLRLAGARHVHLSDTHRLMDLDTLEAARSFLRARSEDLARRLDCPESQIATLLDRGTTGTFEQRLADLGLSYHTPLDYRRATFKVDAIVSHTVMEHITPREIRRILMHSRAVLNPGGLISHGIDHSDHRAHRDTALSRLDFLRYSDRAWSWLCLNPQDYTNRLRHADYMAMIRDAGYEVLFERALVDHKAAAEVKHLKLDARFAFHGPEDLARLWSHIIARPGHPKQNSVLAQVTHSRSQARITRPAGLLARIGWTRSPG